MKRILILWVVVFFGCNSSNKKEYNPSFDHTEKQILLKEFSEEIIDKDTIDILTKFSQIAFKNDTLFYWKKGDINNDKIEDFILILQSKEEDMEITGMPDTYSRKLVLLETVKEYPKFEIRASNEFLIGCSTCGGAGVGDPFQDITIKNNYFSIEELYGACDKTFKVITFKYDTNKKDWFLHKIGQDDYSCRNEDNEDGEIKIHHKEETKKDFGIIRFKDYR